MYLGYMTRLIYKPSTLYKHSNQTILCCMTSTFIKSIYGSTHNNLTSTSRSLGCHGKVRQYREQMAPNDFVKIYVLTSFSLALSTPILPKRTCHGDERQEPSSCLMMTTSMAPVSVAELISLQKPLTLDSSLPTQFILDGQTSRALHHLFVKYVQHPCRGINCSLLLKATSL